MCLLVGTAAHGQDSGRTAGANDSVCTVAMLRHLRANFDDIHDVSMRFHHLDHRLNGLIQLDLTWMDGRLASFSVARNETGNAAFAEALGAALKTWHIPDMAGTFATSLPLRIKIVGSDDSTFSEKAILTGVIRDRAGAPVRDAVVSFTSADDARDTLRHCYSNREGIFVKTLIPAGAWSVSCKAGGFDPAPPNRIRFKQGEHVRRQFALRRSSGRKGHPG
jgi:hypothetical protein